MILQSSDPNHFSKSCALAALRHNQCVMRGGNVKSIGLAPYSVVNIIVDG